MVYLVLFIVYFVGICYNLSKNVVKTVGFCNACEYRLRFAKIRTAGRRDFMTLRQKSALRDFVYTRNADGTFNILAVKDLGVRRAEIPEGVVKIDEEVFFCCDGLTEAVLPEGLVAIGARAFADCVNLKNVKFPQSLMKIGAYSFWQCRNFTELTIPAGVREIGEAAFRECYNLKRLEILNGVETIGTAAFYGCVALEAVYLPDSVKLVKTDAFRSYAGGPKTVSAPKTCRFDESAFAEDCKIILR